MLGIGSLIRPWMLWAVGIAFAALVGLLGVQTVRLADAEADLAKEQAAHRQTRLDHAQELLKADAKARKTENDLRADADRIAADAAKEKEDAKAREDALRAAVSDGTRRLRLAARCVSSGAGAASSPAPAGGAGPDEARAELDPATGLALVGIASDGDQAIRERNECFARYEALRLRLNPPVKE